MKPEDGATGFQRHYELREYAKCREWMGNLSGAVPALPGESPQALRNLFQSRMSEPGEAADVAMEYLKLCGEAGAFFLLEWLAEEEDRRVRTRILGLTELLNPSFLLPVMERRLDDPRWYVVRNMVTIMGRLNLPDFVGFMRRAMKCSEIRVTKEVIKVLFNSTSSANAPLVLSLMEHEDKSVRLQALRLVLLYSLQTNEAQAALQKLASADPVPEVRTLAASILG